MVRALRQVEVRTAAADEVPKVAAAFADAFVNDPVFTFLRPGGLRPQARLRTMFAVELELYVLRNGRPCGRLPSTRRGGSGATAWRFGDAEVDDGEGGAPVGAGVQNEIAAREQGAAGDGEATPT